MGTLNLANNDSKSERDRGGLLATAQAGSNLTVLWTVQYKGGKGAHSQMTWDSAKCEGCGFTGGLWSWHGVTKKWR